MPLPEIEAAVAATAIRALSNPQLTAVLQGDSSPPSGDCFIGVAERIYDAYASHRDRQKALLSERDQLLAELLELQKANATEAFYPDCNGSLRFSAGTVEGYAALDAVWHTPLTTIAGLLDKHVEAGLGGGDLEEFECPTRFVEICKTQPAAQRIPTNILYSTDTVGGNSGSPVMNADGEFIAINFDRQRLGLMNEYKWSADFSRSIGVDVRYILWLVGEYDGAPELVREMTA